MGPLNAFNACVLTPKSAASTLVDSQAAGRIHDQTEIGADGPLATVLRRLSLNFGWIDRIAARDPGLLRQQCERVRLASGQVANVAR
jgi:hypothetical protein